KAAEKADDGDEGDDGDDAAAPKSEFEISVEEAAALLDKPDVIFWFAGNDAAYEKGHIKGSAHGFAHDMAYLEDIQKCDGLPMCPETAAKYLGERGVSNDTLVIAYEDGKGVNESGIWFFLKLYGHDKVKIMTGGTAEWAAKGHALETGKGEGPKAATFTPGAPRVEMIATMKDVEAGNALVLDARHKFEEFTGQDKKDGMKNATEHVQVARGGHIPGAVFSPWTKYAGNKGGDAGKPLFKAPAKLKKTLGKLEKKGYAADKQVITYCHVGLGRGSFQYLGLKAAGHENVKLYMGGWSEWGNSDKPVETK
ncbi:MAG: sulfurtransferase, partial [Myxococcales bacterium]|nr:sulfurtransferase [Myxococcales bacterium]